MLKITDLEARKHGDSFFPFASYHMDFEPDRPVLDCHWHAEMEFLKVTQGAGLFYLGNRSFSVREGEALFINGGILHRGETQGGMPCSYDAFVFHPQLLTAGESDRIQIRYITPVMEGAEAIPPLIGPETAKGPELLGLLGRLKKLTDSPKEAHELYVKAALLEIFAALYSIQTEQTVPEAFPEPATQAVCIKRSLRFIQARYHRPIRLEEMADAAGLSHAHFSRTFKQIVHMTPFEYLHTYRINRSARLLRESDLSLIRISQETGYESVSYFIRRFRRVMGCTPGDFRKNRHRDVPG